MTDSAAPPHPPRVAVKPSRKRYAHKRKARAKPAAARLIRRALAPVE